MKSIAVSVLDTASIKLPVEFFGACTVLDFPLVDYSNVRDRSVDDPKGRATNLVRVLSRMMPIGSTYLAY
jgi:hypothetical protein